MAANPVQVKITNTYLQIFHPVLLVYALTQIAAQ